MFVHYLWVGPVETIVVTYFMYQEIGISAIFGTLFLLAFIPFQCKYKEAVIDKKNVGYHFIIICSLFGKENVTVTSKDGIENR